MLQQFWSTTQIKNHIHFLLLRFMKERISWTYSAEYSVKITQCQINNAIFWKNIVKTTALAKYTIQNRVAHFLVFQFPVGKREKWPISWSGKTRKPGKIFTVTIMSNFLIDFAKILEIIELGPIVIFAYGKSFLDGTQMLIYSQN